MQYHPNGAIKQFTYGNGIVHTMQYNARQLPASSVDSGGVLHHIYQYDENGNVVSILDQNDATKTRTMEYDALDRLTEAESVAFGGDHAHRFSYDALDNMRSWRLAGVKDFANYSYDATNRLSAILNSGGTTVHALTYDSQGNLRTKDGSTYHFDYGNRLRAVVSPTVTETYRYDGHGRRVLAWTSAGNRLFMYSQAGQMVFDHHEPNQVISDNIYLNGSLVAIREVPMGGSTPTVKYQHTDALGTPVVVTSAQGVVLERDLVDPYGGRVSGAKDGIGYTGHVEDPGTDLVYMQQRYYDPAIGRLLSVDPVAMDLRSGANFNRYWYGNNNPYRFTDPDGRQAIDDYGRPASQCPGCALVPMGPNGERAFVPQPVVADSLMAMATREDSIADYLSLDQGEVSNGLNLVSTLSALFTMVAPNPITAGVSTLTGYASAALNPSPESAVEVGLDFVGGKVKPASEAVGNGIEGASMIFGHREDINTVVQEVAGEEGAGESVNYEDRIRD